jgi:hypothetical protein
MDMRARGVSFTTPSRPLGLSGKFTCLCRNFNSGILEHMKTFKKEGENGSAASFEEKQLKRLVMLATAGLKLGRDIYKQLESVEVSLDIIAREIARQSERAE